MGRNNAKHLEQHVNNGIVLVIAFYCIVYRRQMQQTHRIAAVAGNCRQSHPIALSTSSNRTVSQPCQSLVSHLAIVDNRRQSHLIAAIASNQTLIFSFLLPTRNTMMQTEVKILNVIIASHDDLFLSESTIRNANKT